MRLIDADKVKADSRKHCIDCKLNGTKQCKTCVINLICERLDLQPTVDPQGEFTRKELESWLYRIAYNNIGNELEQYCVELIKRLNGFERFVSDMRGDKNG